MERESECGNHHATNVRNIERPHQLTQLGLRKDYKLTLCSSRLSVES